MITNEHEQNGNEVTLLVNVNALRCPFHPILCLGMEHLYPFPPNFLYEEILFPTLLEVFKNYDTEEKSFLRKQYKGHLKANNFILFSGF